MIFTFLAGGAAVLILWCVAAFEAHEAMKLVSEYEEGWK